MLKGIDNLSALNYSAYNRVSEQLKTQVTPEQAKKEEQPKEQRTVGSIDLRLDDIKPRKNASLEVVSLSLSEPNGFEMKGRDSDLADLDMEKAVSDMQKDQALMQYQYFVGETNVLNNEDGIVIQK